MKESTLAVCALKSVSTFPSASLFTSRGEGDNLDTSDNLDGKVTRRAMVDCAAWGVSIEIMLPCAFQQLSFLEAIAAWDSLGQHVFDLLEVIILVAERGCEGGGSSASFTASGSPSGIAMPLTAFVRSVSAAASIGQKPSQAFTQSHTRLKLVSKCNREY